jgi:hypothetical protein
MNEKQALVMDLKMLTEIDLIYEEEFEEFNHLLNTISTRNYIKKMLKTDVRSRRDVVSLDDEELKGLKDDVGKLMTFLSKTFEINSNQFREQHARAVAIKICEILDFLEVNIHKGIMDQTFKENGFPKSFELKYNLMLNFSRFEYFKNMKENFRIFSRQFYQTERLSEMNIESIHQYYQTRQEDSLNKFKQIFESIPSRVDHLELSNWLKDQSDLKELALVDNDKLKAEWNEVTSDAIEKVKSYTQQSSNEYIQKLLVAYPWAKRLYHALMGFMPL